MKNTGLFFARNNLYFSRRTYRYILNISVFCTVFAETFEIDCYPENTYYQYVLDINKHHLNYI